MPEIAVHGGKLPNDLVEGGGFTDLLVNAADANGCLTVQQRQIH